MNFDVTPYLSSIHPSVSYLSHPVYGLSMQFTVQTMGVADVYFRGYLAPERTPHHINPNGLEVNINILGQSALSLAKIEVGQLKTENTTLFCEIHYFP